MDSRGDNMKELIVSNVLQVVIICLNGMIGYFVWYLQKQYGNKSAHNKAIQLMLKRELKEIWKDCKKKKYISIDELNEFEEIYNTYHDLGGNGIATKWYNEILEMEAK